MDIGAILSMLFSSVFLASTKKVGHHKKAEAVNSKNIETRTYIYMYITYLLLYIETTVDRLILYIQYHSNW